MHFPQAPADQRACAVMFTRTGLVTSVDGQPNLDILEPLWMIAW